MILKEDLEKIEQWLQSRSVKDTQFPVIEKIDDSAYIPVVYNSKNYNVKSKALVSIIPDASDDNSGLMSSEDFAKLKNLPTLPLGNYIITNVDEHYGNRESRWGLEISTLLHREDGDFKSTKYIDLFTADSTSAGLMSPTDKNNLDALHSKIDFINSIFEKGVILRAAMGQTSLNGCGYYEDFISTGFTYITPGTTSTNITSLKINAATPTTAGVMSASDKAKLDSIVLESGGITIDTSDLISKSVLEGQYFISGKTSSSGEDGELSVNYNAAAITIPYNITHWNGSEFETVTKNLVLNGAQSNSQTKSAGLMTPAHINWIDGIGNEVKIIRMEDLITDIEVEGKADKVDIKYTYLVPNSNGVKLITRRPIEAATTTTAGVMSAEDKTRIENIVHNNVDNIDDIITYYVSTDEIDTKITATKEKVIINIPFGQLKSNGKMHITSGDNYEFPTVSKSSAGVMTAEDKEYLDRCTKEYTEYLDILNNGLTYAEAQCGDYMRYPFFDDQEDPLAKKLAILALRIKAIEDFIGHNVQGGSSLQFSWDV